MKVPNEPVSAFSVYSEMFRQKKKSKPSTANGGIKKLYKKPQNNSLTPEEIKKLDMLLEDMMKKSSSVESLSIKRKNVKESVSELKIKPNSGEKEKSVPNENSIPNITDSSFSQEKKSENLSKNRLKNKHTGIQSEITPPFIVENNKCMNGFIVEDKSSCEANLNVDLKTNSEQKSFATRNNPKQNSSQRLKFKKKNLLKTKDIKSNDTVVDVKMNNLNIPINNVGKSKTVENIKSKHIKLRHRRGSNIIDQSIGNMNNIDKKNSKVNLQKKKKHVSKEERHINLDSRLTARRLFEWLILPISLQEFMNEYWEKRPLLIQRPENQDYYSELLSTPAIDTMLRENMVHFTKHLDVTSYTDGVRETHNLTGRAQANVVWDFYHNGCSIRLLNPQAFIPKIHTLNDTLQEYFGCFVGANVYLTPPNSQGFAPHYDDIEAFVLQIEGKKHWKVYPPRHTGEALPRFSSPNFSQEEIGKSCLDVTLEPGDILYFPRGFIHQASTVEGHHSLHITLSAYQKTAWVDLFEKALPLALKRAAAEDVEFRRGLPLNYLGLEFHGSDSAKMQFTDTAKGLMSRLSRYIDLSLGAAVDQMGAQFMHDALPPLFTPEEKKNSVLDSGLKMEENGKLLTRAIVEFDLNTKVKLIRSNICRLVNEEDEVRLYHCLDNPLEYRAEDPQFLVLPPGGSKVITFLSSRYPAFARLKDIPHKDEDSLLVLVSDLWDAGLLVTS